MAPARGRDNPWTRSRTGLIGMAFLVLMLGACLGSLFLTLGPSRRDSSVDPCRAVGWYKEGDPREAYLPPFGVKPGPLEIRNLHRTVPEAEVSAISARLSIPVSELMDAVEGPGYEAMRAQWFVSRHPGLHYALGTDALGRSLLVRVLAGGGVSLLVGIAAAFLSVVIGTLYGALSGYIGGKTDAVMMRIVDILYGLPYVLLVVLLAVASEAVVEEWQSGQKAQNAWVKARTRELLREPASQDLIAPTLASINTPEDADRRAALLAVSVSEVSRAVPGARSKLAAWREEGLVKARARELAGWTKAERAYTRDQARVALGKEPCVSAPGPRPEPASPGAGEASIDAAPEATLGDFLVLSAGERLGGGAISDARRQTFDVLTLLFAIGAVSWLTLARVVRGQVLSLKNQPFVEAARAMGAGGKRIFVRHLLPNLLGPVIVYATLTVPQAILQESFLSFLGIGIKPPLPSWGNLASDGLVQLNTHRSYWWLLLFPCLLLGATLLALNFVGEGLREAFDPKRARR